MVLLRVSPSSTNISSPRRSLHLKETSTNVISPRHSPHSKETILSTTTTTLKIKSKGGVKKVSKCLDRPASFWYALCAKYEAGNKKSQCSFLRSKDSGDIVSIRSHQQIFQESRRLIRMGNFYSMDQRRIQSGAYLTVKDKLLQYIELRSQLYIRDKRGLTYMCL